MTSDTNKSPNSPTTRRGFLDWIVGIGTAITGLAMAIPGAMYLWPAARGGTSGHVEVEGALNMSPGDGKTLQVGSQAAIVVRTRDGFKSYSASCTHLGCLVTWNPAKKEFLCPCHAGVFDAQGKVVSGPPPAPLKPFNVKEIGDKVYISATQI